MKKVLKFCWTCILCAGVTAIFSASTDAKTFFVAPQGNNSVVPDGSEEKPFTTLEAARDAARNYVGKEKVDVVVKNGTYFRASSFSLEAQDGGTKDAPVVYRAENPQGAHLSGAVELKAEMFQNVTDENVLDRIPEGARNQVKVLDLDAAGVGNLSVSGAHCRMPLAIPELFVNGERMQIARWPNDGWATVAEIVDSGSKANSGLASDAASMKNDAEKPRGGTFRYTEDAPNRWNAANGVWLWGYWCFDWHDDVLKVASIDAEKKRIEFEGQSTYGLRQGNPSPRRWRAIHLLEELDVPGEYYVDVTAKKLYFYPKCDLSGTRVTLAFVNQPILNIHDASYVTFDGFVLEETYSSGIRAEHTDFLTIENCTIRNTRESGASFNDGNNVTFRGNLVEQNGTGGVRLSSGDRKTLTPGNSLVENNVIRSFAQYQLCYANGLIFGGVGNVARHNEFYDAPHQAVAFGGNNMIFEYNIVHHVCLAGDDAAAFYKGRNPSARGNVLRFNYWYDIGSPRGHGNAAVYFDDGDGGETVFGNVFVRCGDPGKGSFGTIFCHGGHGNVAENNIFVDCKRPLGSAPWNDKRWKEYIDAPLWQTRLLEEVDITSETYLNAYPELKNFMDGAPIEKRHNFASKNVFVRPSVDATGTWDVDATNVTFDHDPGFVDAENGNYALKPDSEIFTKIPGFQAIPFEKMGREPRQAMALPRE